MSGKTYILVHGAGHASWAWKKVVPLLESKLCKVIAVDLPSRGLDTAKLTAVTLDDDAKAVVEAANTTEEKVILVGHSSGGIVIAQAAEMLGLEKVDKLIFLDAFFPQNGESAFSLAEKIMAANRESSNPNAGLPPAEWLIFSDDKKLFRWNPDLVQQLFYHDCPPEDIIFSQKNLTWNSVATIATPVHVSDSRYGSIKKYYILCTQAKDLDKSSMVSNVLCEKVYKLPASHSAFFSMPQELVDILTDIGK